MEGETIQSIALGFPKFSVISLSSEIGPKRDIKLGLDFPKISISTYEKKIWTNLSKMGKFSDLVFFFFSCTYLWVGKNSVFGEGRFSSNPGNITNFMISALTICKVRSSGKIPSHSDILGI